jgi:hypothetical protein
MTVVELKSPSIKEHDPQNQLSKDFCFHVIYISLRIRNELRLTYVKLLSVKTKVNFIIYHKTKAPGADFQGLNSISELKYY